MSMLKELSKYDNLGTPAYFHELLRLLEEGEKKWTSDDIKEYFFNRVIDGRNTFDGCLPLLKSIGIIFVSKENTVSINPSFVEYLRNDNYLNAKLIEWFFVELKEDPIFYNIFCSPNISYDVIHHSIQISHSAFHFKYANVKQFLIDFGFLLPHPDGRIRKLVINPRLRKIFDINVLPEIKKRKVGIEELQRQLDRKRLLGEEAEVFVVQFEQNRLLSEKQPEQISHYWVDAGYDIISYNDTSSVEPDRFIEVKSFVGTPNFYWTRNEMDVAKLKREKYFLYLVDRDLMSNKEYVPVVIQSPYDEILRNDSGWSKQVDKYFISCLDQNKHKINKNETD